MTHWIITSSLLILAVLVIRAVGRDRLSARLRYALWALVLLRLLCPVSIGESPISVQNVLPESSEEIVSAVTAHRVHTNHGDVVVIPQEEYAETIDDATTETTDTTHTSEITQTDQTTQTTVPNVQQTVTTPVEPKVQTVDILRGVWAAGMLLVGAVFLGSNVRFWLRLRRSRRLLTRETVPVYVSAAVETPCLFGFPIAAVYVTPEVTEDASALRHVLAHELTHYRHGDHLWSLLRCAAVTIHWYNPLVWAAAFLSQKDGELACDEGALRGLGSHERTAYAKTLLDLTCVGPRGMLTAATSMTGSHSDLKARVLRIVKNPKMTASACVIALLLAAVIGVSVFTDDPDELEGTWYGAWVETDTYPAWENLVTTRATFRDGRARMMRFENDELIYTVDYDYTVKDNVLLLTHADYGYTEEYPFVWVGENGMEFEDDHRLWQGLLTKGDPKESPLVKDELMEVLSVRDLTRNGEWEIGGGLNWLEGYIVDALQRSEITEERPIPEPLTYTDYCYGITAVENGRTVELILCDDWLYRDGVGYKLSDLETLWEWMATVPWSPVEGLFDENGTEYSLDFAYSGPYVEMNTRHDYRDIRSYAIENEGEWKRAWEEALSHSILEDYDGDVAFYVAGVTHNNSMLNVYADGTMVYFERKELGDYMASYDWYYIPIEDAPQMQKLLAPYLRAYEASADKAERQQMIHGSWLLTESPDPRVTDIIASFNTNPAYTRSERDAYVSATVDGCIVDIRFDIYLQDGLFHIRWFDGREDAVPYTLEGDVLTLHAETGDWAFRQGDRPYDEDGADIIRLHQQSSSGRTVYLNLPDEQLRELETLLRAGMTPLEHKIIYVNDVYYKLVGLEEAFDTEDITVSDYGTIHFNGEGYKLTNWDEIEAFFHSLYRVEY